MKTNRCSRFEIPVKDKLRASEFYSTVFGWQFERQESGGLEMAFFPMDEHAPGAPGALVHGGQYKPGQKGPLVYLYVTDPLDKAIDKVTNAGGKMVTEKMQVGEHGFVAQFIDTEGNSLALHSKT